MLGALEWMLRNPLDAAAGSPEREGLEHLSKLNRCWIQSYYG